MMIAWFARLLLVVGLVTFGAMLIGQQLPNGGVIAYTLENQNGISDLYLLDLASGMRFNLTQTPLYREDHAVWSADGKQIVYHRVADGSSQVCVWGEGESITCYPPQGMWDHSPDWSADGRRISFVSSDTMLFVRDLRDELVAYYSGKNMLIFDPAWSPDGKQIAFVEAHLERLNRSLYIIDPDLRTPQVIVDGDYQVSSPVWSPDGSQIAFAAQSQQYINLFILDVHSGAVRQLTAGGRDERPVWSPDGARIMFVSGRGGTLDLFVINADGTNERRLTDNDALDEAAAWSPHGSQIVFTSDRDGGNQLYVMDVETGATRRITSDANNHYDPAWRPLNP
jgi:TolB protein